MLACAGASRNVYLQAIRKAGLQAPHLTRQPRNGRALWHGLKTLVAGFVPLIAMLAFSFQAANDEPRARPPARPESAATATPPRYREVSFDFGRGYIGDGWQLYFNQPDASAGKARYSGGIEIALAAAIQQTRETLDIAAFELNSEPIFHAILAAHERGVRTRVVADDEHGVYDAANDALRRLQAAGIAVVDDGRSGLMHNKFMILDGRAVWTGSWNFTVNGTYRNNNNAIVLESAVAASAFQAEFDEMFERGEFGAASRDDGEVSFALGDGEVRLTFGAEADELALLKAEIEGAAHSIHSMTFVFSLEELAEAMLLRAARGGLRLQGVFERRNSRASWSQLPTLRCAGADMRVDGNPNAMHHKVIIIDARTVITGSFNFSKSAARGNDENIVIIDDAAIAGLYLDEWRRIWHSAEALPASAVDCD